MTSRYHPYRRRGRAHPTLPTLLRRKLREATRAHAKVAPGHRLKVLMFRTPYRDSFELWCLTCWKSQGHLPTGDFFSRIDGLELYRAGNPLQFVPRAWRTRRLR